MRPGIRTADRAFFRSGPAPDPTYALCRDEPMYASIRERIEKMWARYEPLCPDKHFRSDARTHFVQRMWEMRLACVLLDHGFPLVAPAPKGPDISVSMSPRIWIEAIAVTAGDGPDRVRNRAERAFTEAERGYTDEELPDAGWHGRPPSEESLILRCTNALSEKSKAYEEYLRAGIVKEGEPYIVAISLAGIEDAFYLCNYDELPIFLNAFFGIGAEHLRLSGTDGGKTELHRPHRALIPKSKGIKIPAYAFASSIHPEISGVLGTCTDIVNAPLEPGDELMFVNNPWARSPIASGTFPFGVEFVALEDPTGSEGTIVRKNHRRPYAVEVSTSTSTKG